jgi:hypothetical protein
MPIYPSQGDIMNEEQEEELCGYCAGSGEGQYDGSVCIICKGLGGAPMNLEDTYEG